jgi:DNA processing protein
MTALPPQAFAAALASLGHLTPMRLRALLGRMEPEAAWHAVHNESAFPNGLRGATKAAEPLRSLRSEAAAVDPVALWERCQQSGTAVMVLGSDDYPATLADDQFAPAVLFARGDMGALDRRRVAIVGTRQATAVGREMAAELGAELARQGIAVVSGLAAGIDGAAHRGVLSVDDGAGPVAVVGSGPDVPYPNGHRMLWQAVIDRGLLLAELPPGAVPLPQNFPNRNRIIAALAEIVVVVESRERGGSLLTVNEAMLRERPIMAVPGSPRNPVACGTNDLIRDGALPVHDVNDVLMELGFGQLRFSRSADSRAEPTPADQEILQVLSDRPLSFEEVISAGDATIAHVAVALARLEIGGWVVETAGYYERVHTSAYGRGIR